MREVARCRSLGWGAVVLRDVLGGVGELVERLIGAVSEAYRLESARAGDSPEQVVVRVGGSGGGSMARSRRERVMAAIVEVVAERGYAGASVGTVIERAGVSRRTFYELFPGGMDDGLIAVMDWGLERSGALIAERLEQAGSWQEGVRGALAALLVFLDGDPALARVCLVETLAGGAVLVEHRQRNLGAFRGLIVARITSPHVPRSRLRSRARRTDLRGRMVLARSDRAAAVRRVDHPQIPAALPPLRLFGRQVELYGSIQHRNHHPRPLRSGPRAAQADRGDQLHRPDRDRNGTDHARRRRSTGLAGPAAHAHRDRLRVSRPAAL